MSITQRPSIWKSSESIAEEHAASVDAETALIVSPRSTTSSSTNTDVLYEVNFESTLGGYLRPLPDGLDCTTDVIPGSSPSAVHVEELRMATNPSSSRPDIVNTVQAYMSASDFETTLFEPDFGEYLRPPPRGLLFGVANPSAPERDVGGDLQMEPIVTRATDGDQSLTIRFSSMPAQQEPNIRADPIITVPEHRNGDEATANEPNPSNQSKNTIEYSRLAHQFLGNHANLDQLIMNPSIEICAQCFQPKTEKIDGRKRFVNDHTKQLCGLSGRASTVDEQNRWKQVKRAIKRANGAT